MMIINDDDEKRLELLFNYDLNYDSRFGLMNQLFAHEQYKREKIFKTKSLVFCLLFVVLLSLYSESLNCYVNLYI
jgi:hypothetical protein